MLAGQFHSGSELSSLYEPVCFSQQGYKASSVIGLLVGPTKGIQCRLHPCQDRVRGEVYCFSFRSGKSQFRKMPVDAGACRDHVIKTHQHRASNRSIPDGNSDRVSGRSGTFDGVGKTVQEVLARSTLWG